MATNYPSWIQPRSPASFSGQLQKAQLIPIPSDRGRAELIQFQFNPEALEFSHSNEVNSVAEGRAEWGLKKISFAGPNATTVTINNITFDTFEQGDNVMQKYISKLVKALECTVEDQKSKQTKRPPIYIFAWGTNQYLKGCFVESLGYKITMFLPDGTPVRATARLTLKQVDEHGVVSSKPPDNQGAKGDKSSGKKK